MPNGRYASVGSSHTGIPKDRHWFGLINECSIRSPNHRPWSNSRIMVSLESRSTAVATVHIGILVIESYSDKYGDTMHTSDVNEITLKFSPKQVVSAWLSISHGRGSVKRSALFLNLLTCLIKYKLYFVFSYHISMPLSRAIQIIDILVI